MGYAINRWRIPACTRTSLAILTLLTLITSPKEGNSCSNTCERFAFSRATVFQIYRTMNAINRYTID